MRALLQRGMGRYPLLWTALLAAAAVIAADGRHLAAGSAAFGLIVAAMGLSSRWLLTLGAAVLALLAGSLHFLQISRQQSALQTRMPALELQAKVASPPKNAGRGWSAQVTDDSGARWWFRGLGPAPAYGETIRAGGRFEPLPAVRNPGQFDFGDWLKRKGSSGVFEARQPQATVAHADWISLWTSRLREHFSGAITQGLDPTSAEAAVIRAMVLGESPPDPALVEPFRTSGTLHAFSVSGMHVAMLGAIGWFALRLLRVPRQRSVFVLLAGMSLYVWISGASPPAVRSLTMAGVVLIAFFLRRRAELANGLGLALLAALLGDGHLIFQPGVQLSFGVVGAIAFGTEWAMKPLGWITAMDPYLPPSLYSRVQRAGLAARQYIASNLGMSIAAMAGSTPLLIWHFGLFSPVSILAGLIMGPFIFALMSLAFLSASLSFLPVAPEAINAVNGWVAHVCIVQAEKASAIPGGHLQVPHGRPGGDFLIVYDPGYGGGAAVLHEGGSSILFDTAHKASFQNLIIPSLQRLALEPQSLVLSHPDGGHTGGALGALSAYPIRQALIPVEKARSPGYREFQVEAARRGVKLLPGHPGEIHPISDQAWLEVLHTAPDDLANAAADERVMITRLHWHGWRILFTADAGWNVERALLSSGRDLSADVIVMGRNARDSSGGESFLAAVKPRAIVAAHSDFPAEERIPENWLKTCESAGIRVFHQGRTGAVSLVADEAGLTIRGFMDGSEMTLTK